MFEAQVRTIRDSYDIQPGEVDLPMLPVFALFFPALGLTTVVPGIDPSRPATVDPAAIVQAIQQCNVTNSFGSPVIWRKIADHCRTAGVTLPTIKRVLMAGAPVPPALMADFSPVIPNGVVHSPYGATEALPVTTVSAREILEHTVSRTLQGRGTCVGRPVTGVSVKIVPISDEPIRSENEIRFLGSGEIGEIIVRGPQVTKSYDQLDDPTVEAKIPIEGDASMVWHRMGDTGYIDEDGRLWFCGRKAERVVTKEGVLFTDCCEPIFNQHPHVARSALIGTGHRGEQQPAIVVEPKPGNWPSTPLEKTTFARELVSLAEACETTRGIKQVFFHRRFPVDVRHNAKIHRLQLTKYFANLRPVSLP
jgi:acyl-CoA synthetase (AMP-forming)/AMP-acid ligase II